jgi:hypothetical protein
MRWLAVWGLGTMLAVATPQNALLTGNRCVACHVAFHGGGLRSELGWYSSYDVGLLRWSALGFEALEHWIDRHGNTFWDGRLLVGADFRVQGFQSHNPELSPQWRIFPMQGTVRLGFQPLKAVQAEFGVNGGRPRFPGQQQWRGLLRLSPWAGTLTATLGFFPPPVGIYADDHTRLARRFPGARFDSPQETYLMAPDFAQWGAQLEWMRPSWLSLTVGAFRAGALQQVRIRTDTGERPLSSSQATIAAFHGWLAPSWRHAVGWLGGSWYGNREFAYWSLFGGAGWIDHAAGWVEYTRLHLPGVIRRWSLSAELELWLWNAVMPYVRLEHGESALEGLTPVPYTTQLVLGARLFVLPFVELRPEWRWVDTERYRSSRIAAQLHLFY